MKVFNRRSNNPPRTYWRWCGDSFDPIVFDESALDANGMIVGVAEAGRGNTFFLKLGSLSLVLRHYRRGGLAQHISQDRYFYTGLERTRAMREFQVLLRLKQLALPAPRPFACCVSRQGLFYTASLVSETLPGQTLAQLIRAGAFPGDELWQSLGSTIARFHACGLYHADLNAHNVMIDDSKQVYIIDFDRACFRDKSSVHADKGWCLDNLIRLKRSLLKICRISDDEARDKVSTGQELMEQSWRIALSSAG